MGKKNPPITSLKSLRDVNDKLGRVAADTNERDRMAAEMETNLQAIRDHYGKEINPLDTRIQAGTVDIKNFCLLHPEEFKEGRSINLINGVVGFKTNPRKVTTAAKKSWDKVLNALKATTWGKKYVRWSPEVNKDAILEAADGDKPVLTPEKLKEVGIRIVQDETFYIEINKDGGKAAA